MYASSPVEQAVTQQRTCAFRLAGGDQRDDHPLAQRFPRLGVAEEPGHVDQQVVGQRGHLGRALPQELHVLAHVGEARQAHAPLDPPQDGRLLVPAEILAGARCAGR